MGACYNAIDLLKIIVAKTLETDEVRGSAMRLWHENQNLKRQIEASMKIVNPREVKNSMEVKIIECELQKCRDTNDDLRKLLECEESMAAEKDMRLKKLSNEHEELKHDMGEREKKMLNLEEKLEESKNDAAYAK